VPNELTSILPTNLLTYFKKIIIHKFINKFSKIQLSTSNFKFQKNINY